MAMETPSKKQTLEGFITARTPERQNDGQRGQLAACTPPELLARLASMPRSARHGELLDITVAKHFARQAADILTLRERSAQTVSPIRAAASVPTLHTLG